MYTRTHNADALRAEGHYDDTPKEHHMTFTHFFKDRFREKEGRPIVDVSAPFNAMDETHKARKFGMAKGTVTFLSLNHFSGIPDQVPYTDSHHSFELGAMGTFALQVIWINTHMGRMGNGNVPINNPHFFFATSLVTYIGLARVTLAAAVASFGYFYAYEFLYTYVPGFKIRDPSPNGWYHPWQEDQSTYRARIAASVFPALGQMLYSGRRKRAGFPLFAALGFGLQYEYARINVLPGNRLFYNFQAEKFLTKEANLGSLAGDFRRKNDADTARTLSASQFRYTRMTAGLLQDTIWENATHENLPGSALGYRAENPYFNWQKAPQNYLSSELKVKNDLWKLPSVLNARNMSGALDAR